MWWIVAAILLVIFWGVLFRAFAPAINMILHAHAISYNKKHQLAAKLVSKGIDVCFYLSCIYVVLIIVVCLVNYFK